MKPISHKQAQDWLQNRLDGHLEETQAAALEQHLKNCADCQGFAARLERLDLTLRAGFRARAQAREIAVNQPPLPDGALPRLQNQMRQKMKTKQMTNFTTSIAFIAAMAVLAVGFSWLISTQTAPRQAGPQVAPAAIATATPAPAATPGHWTKDAPLSDPLQVIAILDDLAQKNIAAYQQPGWVHILRQDQSRHGSLPTNTSYSDGWFQYPMGEQTCISSMEVVAPEPGATPTSILVSRSGGSAGDLVQLRSGSGQVGYLKPGDYGCSLKPEFTLAGHFAARLMDEQALSSVEKMNIKAWYEQTQGRERFLVSAVFSQPANEIFSGIIRDTYSFDAENGLPAASTTRFEQEDGVLFGDSAQVFEIAFVPALPVDAAAQWKEFSGELQAFVTGAGAIPSTTPAP